MNMVKADDADRVRFRGDCRRWYQRSAALIYFGLLINGTLLASGTEREPMCMDVPETVQGDVGLQNSVNVGHRLECVHTPVRPDDFRRGQAHEPDIRPGIDKGIAGRKVPSDDVHGAGS